MQMHACWDVIAEHAEQLESILRTIATNGDSAYLDATRQQVALLAADGLQLARSLMLTHSLEDADSGFASKTVLRLLSNISILLTALSKCCAAREQ
jgi:hypothetical protein